MCDENKLFNSKRHLKKALELNQQTSNDVGTHKCVAASFHEIGQCLIKMNKLFAAKEYLEKALEIHQQTSNDLPTDKCVATSFH